MPLGRPTDYDPKYCQMLIDYLEIGHTYEEFAGSIDVSVRTLVTWEKKHEEFLHAKQRGRAKGLKWWMDEGRKGLWSEKSSQKKGNVWETTERKMNDRIWIFCMKNMYKWRDNPEELEERQEDFDLPDSLKNNE